MHGQAEFILVAMWQSATPHFQTEFELIGGKRFLVNISIDGDQLLHIFMFVERAILRQIYYGIQPPYSPTRLAIGLGDQIGSSPDT